MAEPLDHLLRLVAEGRLTAEEAAPLLEALRRQRPEPGRDRVKGSSRSTAGGSRTVRVQVRERGRVVVDLRIPGSLAGLAAAMPGLPAEWTDRVREALAAGVSGPVVTVGGSDGDGVSVSIE